MRDSVSRENYDLMVQLKNEEIRWYRMEANHLIERLGDYVKLQNENGYLKALFDKEADTQVIKYNGKLYRIVSTSHFRDECGADTLDINAVCVSEVG